MQLPLKFSEEIRAKMKQDLCQICQNAKYKYSCPRCNILYCSVLCYKSECHLNCSEQFYEKCVQEELRFSGKPNVRKLFEMLNRVKDSQLNDNVDSSFGNLPLEISGNEPDSDDDETEENLMTRMRGIDLNDSEKVWHKLTVSEKHEFDEMVKNGEIMKLLPIFEPWWCRTENTKIVEVSNEYSNVQENISEENILKKIPKFNTIFNKTPSPCLHYNLVNVLTAYSCTVRFFDGDHQIRPVEAATHLIDLSTNLKSNSNFDSTEQAIISVEMESLAQNIAVGSVNRKQIENDVKQLMSFPKYKLIALSDIHNLLKGAKTKAKKNSDFRRQLNNLTKKMEFFLAHEIDSSSYLQ